MFFFRIIFLIISITRICQSVDNFFNISLAIVNTRIVLACGSSIISYPVFSSTDIARCPYVNIDKNIQFIYMNITNEEARIFTSSPSTLLLEPMIQLNNNTCFHPTNFTTVNTCYFPLSSEMMCRYSFIKNTTICFYYPSTMNFIEFEAKFDRFNYAYHHLSNPIRRRYTFIITIIGILVVVICFFAMFILCSSQLPYRHRIQLDVRLDPQIARETALKLAPEPISVNMFFIVFVLFFSNILQVNAVKCMTNENNNLFTIFDNKKCGFNSDFKAEMLTDAQMEGLNHCKSHEADTGLLGLIQGSCYGEVTIDYTNETRSFYFTHVPAAKALLDPYDDMFGFSQTAESLVQYKIDGNLEKNTFRMTTRVQCRTSDNCATEKIRSLLKNLTLSDPRKTIFQDLRNLLLGPTTTSPTSLSCMKKNNEDETCSTDNDRCHFDMSTSGPTMFCTKADPNQLFDIEYRMNIIEKMREIEIRENQQEAFKCFYICRTDLCNSYENFEKVDNFLYALAMGSATKAKETPNTNPASHYRKTSSTNIPIFHTSFNERLMIIFFILIQF